MKIFAVIVTYNRLPLLKQSIEAVLKQTRPVDKLIVVDNASTDGTPAYLSSLAEKGDIEYLPLPTNVGGAGGFKAGLKKAVVDGCDWAWMMDDDTLPHPDALEKLVAATELVPNVGFVCSKVVWTDGNVHLMNLPGFLSETKDLPMNRYSTPECPAMNVGQATFVSFMVSAKAVRKVGLPLGELFIWSDDVEFSKRILQEGGFVGLYVDNSVVVHATGTNNRGNWSTSPASEAWKFFYQARNERYLTNRKRSAIGTFLANANYVRRMLRRINRRTTDDKQIFREMLRKGVKASMHFKAEVEYID